MKAWHQTISAKWQSLYNYLCDWKDCTATEARRLVEEAMEEERLSQVRRAA